MKAAAERTKQISAPAASFQCPHCGAGPFNTRDELRKHIYDAHVDKR